MHPQPDLRDFEFIIIDDSSTDRLLDGPFKPERSRGSFRVVNWLNAFGALFVGYRHYNKLDHGRRELKSLGRRSLDSLSAVPSPCLFTDVEISRVRDFWERAPLQPSPLPVAGVWLRNGVHDRISFQVPFLVSFCGLGVLLRRRLREKIGAVYPSLWLLVPSGIGLVFWFLIFPALRLSQSAIWTVAGTLGTCAVVFLISGSCRMNHPILVGLSLLLI
jgi:hypothetical protein